ncbi:MAG TPA: hypothetical protein VF161_02570 [Steroidobacteraceae bacterium]
MYDVRTLRRSFAGGEITPEMYGRIDFVKFQTGLALAKNFITLPHGPAVNRPGTRFIHEVKDSSRRVRLIPFRLGDGTTYVIEFGHLYIRFYTNGGIVLSGGVPYEVASPYTELDIHNIHYAQSADTLTLTHPGFEPRELKIIAPTNWTLTIINFDSPISPPTNVSASVDGPAAGADPIGYAYGVTAVNDDGQESTISLLAGASNDLWIAGHRNLIEWDAHPDAAYYNVYKKISGSGLLGFIGQEDTVGSPRFIDQNHAPDITRNPPVNDNPFPTFGDWPTATAYFEQRRVFAGTLNKPQNVWMTRSGSDSNMSKSEVAIQDDDPITFRIASREANNIKHIVPLDELLLFSGSAVWRVFSNSGDALTPTSIVVRPTVYVGASNVQPITVNNAVLFEEDGTGHVQELRYTSTSDRIGYQITDASLFATHLFDGFSLADMAYSTKPHKVVWAVRSDGVLLGVTYIPGQDILGWHQHHTDGEFESVAVVPESGDADGVYVVVKRTIGGVTKRYVEKLELGRFNALEDSFYVDSGLSYDGPATTTFGGLAHLEGKTVSILADGAVVPQQVVTGGQITLATAASKVHVGLPIIADFQTLPLDYEADGAFGVGVQKNINKVHLRVHRTSGIKAGPSFDQLREFPQRTDELLGSPPGLFTGVATLTLDPHWGSEGQVCVRQDQPLPISILSIALEVTLGD